MMANSRPAFASKTVVCHEDLTEMGTAMAMKICDTGGSARVGMEGEGGVVLERGAVLRTVQKLPAMADLRVSMFPDKQAPNASKRWPRSEARWRARCCGPDRHRERTKEQT